MHLRCASLESPVRIPPLSLITPGPTLYPVQPSCEALLLGFDRDAAKHKDWNAYRQFEPEKVMAIFRRVFLAAPGMGDGQMIPVSGQQLSGVGSQELSCFSSSADASVGGTGSETLKTEQAAAAEAEALANAEAVEMESRRTLARLTSGGSRMPCYGK